jgi:hypothetical protein
MADQEPKLSMIGAFVRALRRKTQGQTPVEGTLAATPELEEASKQLPASVMPRNAIEQKRARLKRLDEETK